MRRLGWIAALVGCLTIVPAVDGGASMLRLADATRAGTLTCYPVDGRPGEWRYLPSVVRLVEDESGRPKFSFVRYAAPSLAGDAGASTIQEAAGGGILHFLVTLDTPARAIAVAEKALQERFEGEEPETEVRLVGPVPFQAGRYVLVSSVLRQGETAETPTLLASGRAPVLEGNQLALSFDLSPRQSTLLMESLRSATPDVSLQFELSFEGLTDAYEAKMTVDWSAVRKQAAGSAGASLYFVHADVEAQVDKLQQDGAIKLETSGQDADSETLIQAAYDRAVELLFNPIPPEELPEEDKTDVAGDLLGSLSKVADAKDGAVSSRKLLGIGASMNYQYKEIERGGTTVLDLNHRSVVPRHHLIVFNAGDLYARLGEDPDHFRTVNLEDPTFRKRVVEVNVDASLRPEFGSFVNNVVVTLRKRHESGAETLREVIVDGPDAPSEGPEALRMAYGWDDQDLTGWLRFEVREQWSFQGGGRYETGWKTIEAPMINVMSPFERREIQVLADRAVLKEQGIRSVVVRVTTPFFGQTKSQQVVIRPDRDEAEPVVPVILPRGEFHYDWTVTWMRADGSRLVSRGRDDTGLIFADVLPEPEATEGAAADEPTPERGT